MSRKAILLAILILAVPVMGLALSEQTAALPFVEEFTADNNLWYPAALNEPLVVFGVADSTARDGKALQFSNPTTYQCFLSVNFIPGGNWSFNAAERILPKTADLWCFNRTSAGQVSFEFGDHWNTTERYIKIINNSTGLDILNGAYVGNGLNWNYSTRYKYVVDVTATGTTVDIINEGTGTSIVGGAKVVAGLTTANMADGSGKVRLVFNTINGDTASKRMIDYVQVLPEALPSKAWNASPANNATEISALAKLTWSKGNFANRHNVYFGTSLNAVSESAIPVSIEQSLSSYDPCGLSWGQSYYWRVDEVNTVTSTIWTGDVWTFTVENKPVCTVRAFADMDGDLSVNFADFASIAKDWGGAALACGILNGDLNGDLAVDAKDVEMFCENWLKKVTSKYVETANTVGLDNGKVRMEFSKTTGAMVSLKNLTTNDEYNKGAESDGNPFRIYADTSLDLPPAATVGDPWPVTNVEDAMGGTILDPKNCQLVSSTFTQQTAGGKLSLVMHHTDKNLTFNLDVTITDGNEVADFRLVTKNDGTTQRKVMTAFPYLTGLTIGDDRGSNRGVRLRQWGLSDVPAWNNNGWVYPLWNMQWNAVYNKSSDEGLGVIAIDGSKQPNKIVRRFPPSGMSICHYPAKYLAAGQSSQPLTVQIIVSKGNWRFTADEYSRRIRQIITPRQHPKWLNDVTQFANGINFEWNVGTGPFQSYADMPYNYLVWPHEVLARGFWMEKDCCLAGDWAPTYNGDYTVRGDLGGASAMKIGSDKIRAIGRRILLAAATHTIHTDAYFFSDPRYPSSNRNDWRVQSSSGEAPLGAHKNFYACFGYSGWRQRFADICTRLVRDAGVDGIYMDEGGGVYWPCFNPAHHHGSPYNIGETFWGIDFHRMLREALDAVDPNAVLIVENVNEFLTPYADGAHQGEQPGSDITPFRYVFPEFISNNRVGAIPGALNNDTLLGNPALANDGWYDPYFDFIFGIGGQTSKPTAFNGYTNGQIIAKTPYLIWPEMSASFKDVLVNANCTFTDPVACDVSNPQDYVARLWKGSDYWLFVGGHVAGWAQSQPVRFKLPELPAEITTAYEFDTTVSMLVPDTTILTRDETGTYLTVNSGFSAIVLPFEECPMLPMVNMVLPVQYGSPSMNRGGSINVPLYAFAPWDSSPDTSVTVTVPGLKVNGMDSVSVTLPSTVTIYAPSDIAPGWYYLIISGDNSLPAKRYLYVR